METRLEVAIIQASCDPVNDYRLYWTVSRNQLEFILQNIEVFHSPPFVDTAQYQEKMLPVISLEGHFGLVEERLGKTPKYLVVRAVNANQGLVRLIIETQVAVKLQKVEQGLIAPFGGLAMPRNNMDILGVFALSEKELAIVPDIAGISRSLKVRGDYTL